jgi:hypothetical protein
MNAANQAVKLATVWINNPPLDVPGDPPPVTIDGLQSLLGYPVLYYSALGAGDSNQIAWSQAGGLLSDADSDGVVDDSDNCVFTPNVDQLDVGGLLRGGSPPDGDGKGDACQCGEAHGPGMPGGGRIDSTDTLPMLQALTGEIPNPSALQRCSVSSGGVLGDNDKCDIKDIVVVNRAVAQAGGPGILSVCRRAVSVFSGDNQ